MIDAKFIDKSAWDDGPWQTEVDRKEWKDPATGLPCLAKRNDHMGFWCGYVAVPPGHPLHGKSYDDADVDVHGGLTYANRCGGEICHVPEPGEPDNVFWFGFDCGHYNDVMPAYNARLGRIEIGGVSQTYKTITYVEAECTRLAAQLAALA